MASELSGFSRFLLAFSAFLKIWFDRPFAEKVWAIQQGTSPSLPAAPAEPKATEAKVADVTVKPVPVAAKAKAADPGLGAIHLLSILQRDGRLVDFLQEDLGDAPDADLAAVVRSTIYAGCRGDMITVEAGFDPHAIRLTGNVVGSPPFKGTLKHRGWKVVQSTWPEPPAGFDGAIVAPAEVELP
jgi:hypothetical protein